MTMRRVGVLAVVFGCLCTVAVAQKGEAPSKDSTAPPYSTPPAAISDPNVSRKELLEELESPERALASVEARAVHPASLGSCSPWLKLIPPYSPSLLSVAFNGSRWVAVGNGGDTEYSDDGQNWTWHYIGLYKSLSAVRWSGSRFVLVGETGIIASSPDGRTWTQHGSPTSADLRALASNGGRMVAVGRGGTIIWSPDGQNWTLAASPTTANIFAVASFKGRFVAIDGNGMVIGSSDGAGWQVQGSLPNFPQYGSILGMASNNALLMAAGFEVSTPNPDRGIIYKSSDGVSWTRQDPTNQDLRGLTFGGGKWVVVGDSTLLESFDATFWTLVQSPLDDRIWDVAWGNNQYIAVGWKGIALSTCTPAQVPVADFTWSPLVPSARQVVQFNDTSTGAPIGWTWDFGDGAHASDQNPKYAYLNGGAYTVSLTVNNTAGSASTSKVLTVAGASGSFVYWIPVATHVDGLNDSQWRTDLGILNTGIVPLNFELRFHSPDGIKSATSYVAPHTQSVLEDVIGQLGVGASGALEIRTDQPARVTSRTYNLVVSSASCYPDGTFGQDYPVLTPSDGVSAGQEAHLSQLAESARFRTNIGIVNLGDTLAAVTVSLHDGAGGFLTSYTVNLAPGQWSQETRPFYFRAGLTTMTRGYAKITVGSGSGVVAFASVVDNLTNDPTTVTMSK
jgi:PKD repeat protein